MKTQTEAGFDTLIKEGFQQILKPLGFRKKRFSFYRQKERIGHCLNVQKSAWYSKNHILFTINTGIFLPEYWAGMGYNQGKQLPDFPVEPECLLRKRIGALKSGYDLWFDLDESTNLDKLTSEMRQNLYEHILPHFDRLQTLEEFLVALEQEKLSLAPMGKLIAYGELKLFDKAKEEYTRILNSNHKPLYLDTVIEYGAKYGFELKMKP